MKDSNDKEYQELDENELDQVSGGMIYGASLGGNRSGKAIILCSTCGEVASLVPGDTFPTTCPLCGKDKLAIKDG